jgi:hypothetical protein
LEEERLLQEYKMREKDQDLDDDIHSDNSSFTNESSLDRTYTISNNFKNTKRNLNASSQSDIDEELAKQNREFLKRRQSSKI